MSVAGEVNIDLVLGDDAGVAATCPAPLDAMREAARAALAGSGNSP